MMFADQAVSFDATDVMVAFITGVFLLAAAFVTAGFFTKRNVRKGVEAGLNGKSEAELEELQGIRSEVSLMRTAITTSNNLNAQQWSTMDRRVTLIENRVQVLEKN